MEKGLNIYTIAREAEVSPSTVSRVMTKSANVSDEKRKRVEHVITKYNYRPNALAQGLSNTRTNVIAILAAEVVNPYYSNLITNCEYAIEKHGYVPLISSTMNNEKLEIKYLQKLYDMRVDAVILLGGKSDDLVTDREYAELVKGVSAHIPIVTTGKIDGAACHQVTVDEKKGVELLMQHLCEKQHKRIALLGGTSDAKSTYDKRNCYKTMLKKYGIPYHEEYVKDSDYSIEGGYQVMKELFEEKVPVPTAVIAINDYSAVGIMRAIKEKGMRIPQDIAIVSFDDTFVAEAVIPKLTSISYDYKKYGELLVGTAIQLIQGEKVETVRCFSSKISVRESSDCVFGS